MGLAGVAAYASVLNLPLRCAERLVCVMSRDEWTRK